MTISVSGIAGPCLTTTDNPPQFATGTVVNLDNGGQGVYVQAVGNIAQYDAVSVRADDTAQSLTTTLAASSKRVGWAQVAIASGDYGWVINGSGVTANLAASCQPNVPLYTTATAGVLDDAVVSGGLVVGTVATTSVVTAGPAAIVAGYPHIGTGTFGS